MNRTFMLFYWESITSSTVEIQHSVYLFRLVAVVSLPESEGIPTVRVSRDKVTVNTKPVASKGECDSRQSVDQNRHLDRQKGLFT